MALSNIGRVAVVVAHPDDETLWCGGLMLLNPACRYHIVTLCRANDPDRAPRFRRVLEYYGASGAMADLDDEPEQTPLDPALLENTIPGLLGTFTPEVILTHSPRGEYTRHRRHEETARAVLRLWERGMLGPNELRLFAYDDGGRSWLPRTIKDAPLQYPLPSPVWERKYHIITELYGFDTASWEARSTPREEAFWQVTSRDQCAQWLMEGAQ